MKITKDQMTKQLVEVITQPEFQKFIQEVEEQPSNEMFEYAKRETNIAELNKRGIKIPDDFKITIRNSNGKELTNQKQTLTGGWSICVGTVITVCYAF